MWAKVGREAIRAALAERDVLTGRRVIVRGPGGTSGGRVQGIDLSGSLVVRDSSGQRRALTVEEVLVAD